MHHKTREGISEHNSQEGTKRTKSIREKGETDAPTATNLVSAVAAVASQQGRWRISARSRTRRREVDQDGGEQAKDGRRRGREHDEENREVLEDVGESRGEEGI